MKSKTYLSCLILILISIIPLFFINVNSEFFTGSFTFIDIAPEKFIFEEPADISAEAASFALEQAQDEITDLKVLNLKTTIEIKTTLMEDVLQEAKESYQQRDYLNVLKLTQFINFIKIEKIEFLDRMILIEEKKGKIDENKVNLENLNNLIDQALSAFEQEQIEDANFFLNEVDTELNKATLEYSRSSGLTQLSKNFFLRNWWQILIVLVIIAIASQPLTKKIFKKMRTKKLAKLKEELVRTRELIKDLQKETFVTKKISTDTYKAKVAKSEESIAELNHIIPVLEAQLHGKKEPEPKRKLKGILEVKNSNINYSNIKKSNLNNLNLNNLNLKNAKSNSSKSKKSGVKK